MNNISLKISYIDQPAEGVKYRRRIWGGVRTTPVGLGDFLYKGSPTKFKEEILSVGLYPSLIQWETERGEKKYAVVTT